MASPLDVLLSPVVAIFAISMVVSFIVSFSNRLLANPKQSAEWRKEVSAWMSEFNRANRTGDKRLLAKLKRQQPRINQLQSKIFKESLKVMPVSMTTFLVFWWLILIPLYGRLTVAFLPWFGGEPLGLDLFKWYVLCSFLFGALFSRIFGVGMGAAE